MGLADVSRARGVGPDPEQQHQQGERQSGVLDGRLPLLGHGGIVRRRARTCQSQAVTDLRYEMLEAVAARPVRAVSGAATRVSLGASVEG